MTPFTRLDVPKIRYATRSLLPAVCVLVMAVAALQPSYTSARAESETDGDSDGVADSLDACPDSPSGFPVTESGCALLDGVLTGVTFTDSTAQLASGATQQLDYLADLLRDYPDVRIELRAHTDDRGSARDQAIITRQRLRTVGLYLVDRGISAKRLVMRSLGGSQPLYDNTTPAGRIANNRIEVIQYLP